eukprot:TRINITY_DN31914_c0_g1_i1.p1 TRINITY_DN31914_c0_g1~~TRINITY_DN31914_c0_g1_i1.p1  ORF type:complete len:110 (-),score=20.30 TRINITY_DN31914_c0_g1_i1:126-455(-)
MAKKLLRRRQLAAVLTTFALFGFATYASTFVSGGPPVGRPSSQATVRLADPGDKKDGFFRDPLDGTPYETNENTAALVLATSGALFAVFFLWPFLQSYFQELSQSPYVA